MNTNRYNCSFSISRYAILLIFCIVCFVTNHLVCGTSVDGGLLVSIIEMCLAKNIGFNFLNLPKKHKILFGEDQSRYLVAVNKSNQDSVEKTLIDSNIYFRSYGTFTNKNHVLNFPDKSSIKLDYIKDARKLWESKV